MARHDDVRETRSPFLLEALAPQALPAEEASAELLPRLTSVARRLSRRARRHVERALVRQLADTGARDPRVLAGAVASLRRALADGVPGEAEALEVVEEELSSHGEAECECRRCHEPGEAEDDAEACEVDEASEAYDASDEYAESEDGEEEADESYEAAIADELDDVYEALEDGDGESDQDALEMDEAYDAEWESAAWTDEESVPEPTEEEDSPFPDVGASGELEEEDLAGWNEMLESERPGSEDEEAGDAESEDPEMESDVPTPAEIQANLDSVTVSSRTVTLRQAPNPFGLNAVASANTESKRAVFIPLQKTWHALDSVERKLAKGSGSKKALEAKRATLSRRLTDQAEALRDWLHKHPLDHNRGRRQLLKDIKKRERGLARLKGKAKEAATAEHRALKQMLATLEVTLRTAAQAYEPLRDFQRTIYEVRVPSSSGTVLVKLHDHVIAYATDTAGGMDGGADGDTPDSVAAALARSGISEDKQAILRVLSSLEGRFSTVNTWDRAVVTFGFTQWTTDAMGDGTLCKLMDAIRSAAPDAYSRCFQRYGLDLDPKRRFRVSLPDGRVLAGGPAARHVQTSVKHVAVLSAAGMDPDVQTAQIRFAEDKKIDAMLAHRLSAGGKSARLADLLTSEYSVGVMMDRAAGTGEPGTRGAAQRAFAAFVKSQPDADLTRSADREAAGARVLAAIVGLDRGRARRYEALSHEPGSFAG